MAVTLSHPAVLRGSKGHFPSKGQVTRCSSAHEKKKGALPFTINVLVSNSTQVYKCTFGLRVKILSKVFKSPIVYIGLPVIEVFFI